MKRVLPIAFAFILTSFIIMPVPILATNSMNSVMADDDIASLLPMAQNTGGVFHSVRVAVYSEANTTVPSYSFAEGLTNHLSEVVALLEDAGYSVDLLSTQDILDHKLMTADYDVLVLVNNLPRESIYNYVKEFWLGGGGILSFNGAISYLIHSGIMLVGAEGFDGRGIAYDYRSHDDFLVTARHPTDKSCHVDDVVSERAGDWVIFGNALFSSYPNGAYAVSFLENATQPMWSAGIAIDNRVRGGRVVQIPGDGNPVANDFETIIVDSVDWLAPRPKGRVVYDLSHSPRLCVDLWDDALATLWSVDNNFGELRNLAANHTFTFDKLYPLASGNLTIDRLQKYDVLIIDWPDLNFTDAEITAVENWVTNGGSIIVLGDRTGLGGNGYLYINVLLQSFDMSLGTTNVLNYVSLTSEDHETTEGAPALSAGYRNYLSVIGDAESIWKDGTNTVVASQEFSQGRAILSGDQNIFDNTQLPQEYNVRFALNALNWLTANDAEVLLLTDYGPELGYHSHLAHALNDLGIPYQLSLSQVWLDLFLDSKSWGLVIINVPNYGLNNDNLGELYTYADAGGRLLMSFYDMDIQDTHPLWSLIGVEHSADITAQSPIFLWDNSHPIFNLPNAYSEANYTWGTAYGDDGDTVTVVGGATALAGATASADAGNALIVLSADGKILLNSYLIDELSNDQDDSTYQDAAELWQNEIAFMMRPTVDSPADVTYIGGATGNTIVWSPASYHPYQYEILQNGSSVASGNWNETQVSINVDGLAAGVYAYQVIVYDFTGNSAFDTVLVTVTPGLFGIDMMIIIAAVAGVVVLVIVLAVVLRKRSGSAKPKPKPKKKSKK
ncbi:MAG: hypothetical protein EAX95_06990 [Candidatus Thorarchaeota archaeon]|nr:hypothetical protein [Candidatus Thorarchaeota archaeon]